MGETTLTVQFYPSLEHLYVRKGSDLFSLSEEGDRPFLIWRRRLRWWFFSLTFKCCETHSGFSAENLCIGNPLSSTLTFLQANCLTQNKKPGLIPPSLPPASAPPWDTIRWITDEGGDHQLEFFQEEACAVVLRPIASSLRCRYF